MFGKILCKFFGHNWKRRIKTMDRVCLSCKLVRPIKRRVPKVKV